MPIPQLFVLAIAGAVLLAVIRVVRDRLGRTPHPEGIARILFGLAFFTVPPLALGALTGGGASLLTGVPWIPLYAVMSVAVLIAMRVAAGVVAAVAPSQARQVLLVALVADDAGPYVPSDPPVTPRLAAIAELVQRSNDVFPRGAAFRHEIDRPGFRTSWDALDDVTRRLEAAMDEDDRLGRGVSSSVTAMARDARARLDTLRQLAVEDGQSWTAA